MRIRILLCCCLLSWTGSLRAQEETAQKLSELLAIADTLQTNKRLVELGLGTEAELGVLMRYYNIKRDSRKSDSVMRLALARFPKGEVAFEDIRARFLAEKEIVPKEKMYFERVPEFTGRDLEMFHQDMAETYLEHRKIKEALLLADQIRSAEAIAVLVSQMTEIDPKAAERLLTARIAENTKSGIPIYPLLNQYSLMLSGQGKLEEALKYADQSYQEAQYKSEDLTRNYVKLLSHARRYVDVVKLLEPEMAAGKSTASSRKELELAYQLAYPEKEAQVYMQGLKTGYLDALRNATAKKMIRKPAPAILGRDMNGKEVSLLDLRGKTVVVDFWSTWCVPCKASFPAMRSAMNRFATDSNVVFFFVHTLDNIPDPLKAASSYLKANKFDFNLLMDYRDPKTKQCPIVTAFGITGIPTKLIIDGNGQIRFASVGFHGNAEAAEEEMSVMIDLTKSIP